MLNNTIKIIAITAIAVGTILGAAVMYFWPKQVIKAPISVDSLISQGKFNGADLVMHTAYTVCPSKRRKYMVAFRGRVHYFIDTNKSPLSATEDPTDSGTWVVHAPAITLDAGFTSDIDKSGSSWRKSWVLKNALFVRDTVESKNELALIDNYAMHIAYQRLTETDEIKKVVSEQIMQFVSGILSGANKKVKNITVDIAKTESLQLPPVNIKFCKDENGVSVKP